MNAVHAALVAGTGSAGSGTINTAIGKALIFRGAPSVNIPAKANARNIRTYGATITPFGGNGYDTTVHEQERQFVSAWFRTATVFDGMIDFDAAVRGPVMLTNFHATFYHGLNANDWLHMNLLGYRAIANPIGLD